MRDNTAWKFIQDINVAYAKTTSSSKFEKQNMVINCFKVETERFRIKLEDQLAVLCKKHNKLIEMAEEAEAAWKHGQFMNIVHIDNMKAIVKKEIDPIKKEAIKILKDL